MKQLIAFIIDKLSYLAYLLLKPFVDQQTLETKKVVHLCWWFEQNNLTIPKYFIGGTSPPSVSTSACTNIAQESVTGNGNITNIGSATPTRRGFCYMVGTSGDPTTSDSVTYEDGSFGTGTYSLSITGLTAGTSYRVRAYAVNSKGTGYGTTVQTATSPPTVTYTKANNVIGFILAPYTKANSVRANIGDKTYSREEAVSLPTDDAELDTAYSTSEYTTVATDDGSRVAVEGSGYVLHQFKKAFTNNSLGPTITWNGQSTLAPSSATVYLQIYNYNTPGWETLSSNNSASAGADFTLVGGISANISNYYTGSGSKYLAAFRVYQAT